MCFLANALSVAHYRISNTHCIGYALNEYRIYRPNIGNNCTSPRNSTIPSNFIFGNNSLFNILLLLHNYYICILSVIDYI